MSARIHVRGNYNLVVDETVTGEYVSEPVKMEVLEGVSFQVKWSGGSDITGQLTIECSVDKEGYCTFAGSNVSMTGTEGMHIYDIVDTHVAYLRVKVSVTSGTSNFTITVNERTREM